jgi:hypothetical protein
MRYMKDRRQGHRGVTEIDPLHDTSNKEASFILTFSLSEQGLYEENKGDIEVMLSEAQASMTQGSSE